MEPQAPAPRHDDGRRARRRVPHHVARHRQHDDRRLRRPVQRGQRRHRRRRPQRHRDRQRRHLDPRQSSMRRSSTRSTHRSTASSTPNRSSRDRAASSAADGDADRRRWPPDHRRRTGSATRRSTRGRSTRVERPGRRRRRCSPYEVVIDRASAENGDLHVGDHTTRADARAGRRDDRRARHVRRRRQPRPDDVHRVHRRAPPTALVGRPGEVSTIRDRRATTASSQDELRDDVAAALPDRATRRSPAPN